MISNIFPVNNSALNITTNIKPTGKTIPDNNLEILKFVIFELTTIDAILANDINIPDNIALIKVLKYVFSTLLIPISI